MKLTFTIVLGFTLCLNSFSQTTTQIENIKKSSNLSANLILKKNLISFDKSKEDKITRFLRENPIYQRNKTINGKPYSMVDVFDGKPIYITTHNEVAAKATRANFLHNGGGLGLNIEGQNMTVGVWDAGNVLFDHVEFNYNFFNPGQYRVSVPDYDPSWDYNTPYNDHATHVSGTINAKGQNTSAKGMAPQALVVSYDWRSDTSEVINEIETNGLLISNHSYGVPVENATDELIGKYEGNAAYWDELHFNNPYYLQVVSAGNDGTVTYSNPSFSGYDKLIYEKNSKNNLVVANAQDPNINSAGELLSINMNSSSSQGPTDDKRIKPDITGNGTGLTSPISSSQTNYGNYSGTSMAAPNVAGTSILLQQYYSEINNDTFMKSATLKGLICHTADDTGGINNGPDPVSGWGLMNAKKAAETILEASNGNAIISELILNGNENYSTTFNASSSGPISVTISWTDPAGLAQNSNTLNDTTPVLVNDLDLVVNDPNGTAFEPWMLNPPSPLYAIKGNNTVDNLENVDIEAPVSGTYTITVSHKGILTNGYPIFDPNFQEIQPFSLIVTGSNLTLGNSNTEISTLHVWPNPAQNEINFEYPPSNSLTFISLVDIQGRKVYEETVSQESGRVSGTIDSSNFARGLYILNVKQGNFSTYKKIILK